MRGLAGTLAAFVFGLGLSGAVLLPALTTPALAQSAADKATARTLAREGIDLFKGGKHAEALDRLQRAQALYDAPVHLIYIARCQAKLGLVVEAAETYRKLVRTELPGNAPEAFKEAVEDARKELPDVEPKIAKLRIELEPKGVNGLKLTIDQAEVSDAVVGVDRPTNPGSRKVTASAPGYKTAEQVVELNPGEKKGIKITLEVDPDAKPDEAPAGTGAKNGDTEGNASVGAEAEPASALGFVVGLRLGGMLPAGELAKDQPIRNYFGSGGGAELRGGIRFAGHFTVLLLGAGGGLAPGAKINADPGTTINVKSPVFSDAGAGFMYAPVRGKLGPFGELAVLFVHRIDATREVSEPPPACQQKLTASGQALRLGGGVQIPINGWFQLSPYAALSIGQMTEFTMDKPCPPATAPGTPWEKTGAVDDDKKGTHVVLGIGVGGDILFGSDKPRK